MSYAAMPMQGTAAPPNLVAGVLAALTPEAAPGFAGLLAAALPADPGDAAAAPGAAPLVTVPAVVLADDAAAEPPRLMPGGAGLSAVPVAAAPASGPPSPAGASGRSDAGADAAVSPRRRLPAAPVSRRLADETPMPDTIALAPVSAVAREPTKAAPILSVAPVRGRPDAVETPGVISAEIATIRDRSSVAETLAIAGGLSSPAPAPTPTPLVSWIMDGMPAVIAVPTPAVAAVVCPPVRSAWPMAAGEPTMPADAGFKSGAAALFAATAEPLSPSPASHDSARDRPGDFGADGYGAEESFIPSPRFALAVLDAVTAANPLRAGSSSGPALALSAPTTAQVSMLVDVPPAERGEPSDASGLADAPLPSAAAPPMLAVASPESAAARGVAAALPEPPDPAALPALASPQLGDVRIGFEGGLADLRVWLAVGSGAAMVAADAPRLAAELAANGIRLQSLEVSDAGVAAGGGNTPGSGENGHGAGDPRSRFANAQRAAASVFGAEAGAVPRRAPPAPDRYA